ncbi:MAG: nucleotidyltransferase domain-containing protein [Candidatus Bathyarchaeota archaeon]
MNGVEVTYTEAHWTLLKALRAEAGRMMEPLVKAHLEPLVYGSIARGDVTSGSDIDIFLPTPPAPAIVEAALERHGVRINSREIIQATPSYAAKAYLYTDDRRGYSYPLVNLRPNEAEFYSFAGAITYKELQEEKRVPGVDKRLILVEPTDRGHRETPVKGVEGVVASKLGVDTRIVLERVRTLERREKVGRTGVYLKRELAEDEDISTVFMELADGKAALRRRLRKRK